MTKSFHGTPCWFELTTSNGDLKSAGAFYGKVLGWQVVDSGMEGFEYRLAMSDGDMVAGLSAAPDDAPEMPPAWLTYFAVDDVDAFVAKAKVLGASVQNEPADIPGTGRFAILSDPQGVAFGALQPDVSQMTPEEIAKSQGDSNAFNSAKAGHCNWCELLSPAHGPGYEFYSKVLGWTKGETMDMGDIGTYQLFQQAGTDIGGMMDHSPDYSSQWRPYFGVGGSVSDTIKAINAAGGSVFHGPQEVPGGSYIALARDPQGAVFAVTGTAK